jgi:hypothetical protein
VGGLGTGAWTCTKAGVGRQEEAYTRRGGGGKGGGQAAGEGGGPHRVQRQLTEHLVLAWAQREQQASVPAESPGVKRRGAQGRAGMGGTAGWSGWLG